MASNAKGEVMTGAELAFALRRVTPRRPHRLVRVDAPGTVRVHFLGELDAFAMEDVRRKLADLLPASIHLEVTCERERYDLDALARAALDDEAALDVLADALLEVGIIGADDDKLATPRELARVWAHDACDIREPGFYVEGERLDGEVSVTVDRWRSVEDDGIRVVWQTKGESFVRFRSGLMMNRRATFVAEDGRSIPCTVRIVGYGFEDDDFGSVTFEGHVHTGAIKRL